MNGILLQTLASNCSGSCQPEVSHINVLNDTVSVSICNLPLVPSWILAVVLGIFFSWKFFSLGQQVTGALAYSFTYLMYAVMISSGLVVHCLYLVECGAQPRSQYYIDAARIDASLTSCIALSFGFNGLIDMRLLPERSYSTMLTMTVSYGLIFYAYFSNVAYALNLYFNSVMLGCSLYMLTQFILLAIDWSNTDWKEVFFLVGAGLAGGSSLFLVKYEYCWLCQNLGPWSIEGLWYYGSDISMLFLGIYIWKSRVRNLKMATVHHMRN